MPKAPFEPPRKVLVLGILTDPYLELQVKGIFVLRSVIDDEFLAPLYVHDFLFLDSNHTYEGVSRDFKMVWTIGKEGWHCGIPRHCTS